MKQKKKTKEEAKVSADNIWDFLNSREKVDIDGLVKEFEAERNFGIKDGNEIKLDELVREKKNDK